MSVYFGDSSALVKRYVTEKGGHLLAIDAATALNTFEQDYRQEFSIVPLTTSLVDDAVALVKKHALRGYDAVQLATALQTNKRRASSGFLPLILLSADTDLNACEICTSV